MTLIDLDSIHFYQSPSKAHLAGKRPSVASVGDVHVICGEGYTPTVPRPYGGWGEQLCDYDLIEDLTGPVSKDPLDLFSKPAPDLKGTELYGRGPSNRLDLTGGHGGGGGEKDQSLPSVEDLLLGAGGAQKSQQMGWRLGEDKGANIDSSSSVYPRSDNSTSEEQGGRHCSLSTPPTSVAGSKTGDPILREKIYDSVFDPRPPPGDTSLSSTFDKQTQSSDGALKGIEPDHSGEGKEKADKEHGDNGISDKRHDKTATGAARIRGSSKRTADRAGLNEGGKDVHGLEKARRAGSITIDKVDDTGDNLNDAEFARIRSRPKPIFQEPWKREVRQHEDTISSSLSSGVGACEDNPFLVEDDGEKISETGASTRATSMESEIGTIHIQSSHPRKQPKTHGCLSPTATGPTTEPTISPFDRPISPSIALSHDRVEQAIRGGDRGAAVTVHPPHAITVTPPLPEQPQDQRSSALDEEEWEIVRIVGKRRRGKGYEYKVCWKKTWLLERELGNAQELLREFEAKHQAQRGGKRGRPARADKGR